MKKELITTFMFAIIIIALMPLTSAAGSLNVAYTTEVLLNQDPDPAEPGKYVELRWKVEKQGNPTLDDITYELEVEYPFSFDSSDAAIKKIGSWSGPSNDDAYYTLYYKLLVDEEAIEDEYPVTLKVKYGSSPVVSKEYDVRVGENIRPEFVLGNVETLPVKLYGDSDENKVLVNLENIGDDIAENVIMELKMPEGFNPTYGYSDRETLGTIGVGLSKVATYYIDIDDGIEAGSYDARLVISYKESDDEDNSYKSTELPVELHISGKPTFKVESVRTEPANLVQGETGDLILTIKNVGSKEAESVSVRAYKESSQPFDFDDKSDFVGKLAPGEIGEAIIKLTIDSDASIKKHLMDVEIRGVYNDEVMLDESVVSLDIMAKEKNNTLRNVVIAIVILALIGFFWYRKRK